MTVARGASFVAGLAGGVLVGRALARERIQFLSREQLLEGTKDLLGGWFSAGYLDDRRRGWGVVFASEEERDAHDPEQPLRLARLGPLTARNRTRVAGRDAQHAFWGEHGLEHQSMLHQLALRTTR